MREGEALLALGRSAEGEATLRRARADAAALGAAPPHWRACLALARFLDRTGRRVDAAAERAEALDLLDRVLVGIPEPDLRLAFEATEPMRLARGGRG